MRNVLNTNAFSGIGNATAFHQSAGPVAVPLFTAFGGESGIVNLTSALTINGSTINPVCRFEGASAGASTWTATVGTGNLTLTGSGSDPTLTDGYTPFTTATERAPKLNAGKVYTAADNSTYDLATATDDAIIEVVFRYNANGGENTLFSKYKSSTGRGPLLLVDSGSTVRTYGLCSVASPPTVVDGAWYHIIIFCDRNGNNRLYLNGSFSATGANANVAETTAVPFTIGCYDTAFGKSSCAIALSQYWQAAAGTINTTAEQDSIALERFARMCGVYPSRATGAYAPTAMTRASTAYLDRVIDETSGVRRLFRVGSNWPRLSRRQTGSSWVSGYQAELATTNYCLQSQTLAHATWTVSNVTMADGYADPAGGTNAQAMYPTAGASVQHRLDQTVSTSANSISVFAKRGSNDWCGVRSKTGSAIWAWFNLNTGVVGTTASCTARIQSMGAGWYRCTITAVANVDAVILYTSNADNTASYAEASGASPGTYFYGVGAYADRSMSHHSYIPTTTATVTRATDVLTYAAASNFSEATGSIEVGLWSSAADTSNAVARTLVSAYKDASNYHDFALGTSTNSNVQSVAVNASTAQVAATGTVTVGDSTSHTLIASYTTNSYKSTVDGAASITEDTSCTMPTALTAVHVGNNAAGTQGLGGLITSLKLWATRRV